MANSNAAIDRILATLDACSTTALERELSLEFTYLYRAVSRVLRSSSVNMKDHFEVLKYCNYFGEQGTLVAEATSEYMQELHKSSL